MDKDQLEKLPIISLSQTTGLTSIDQITSGSENELFSFQDSTIKPENKLIVVSPFYESLQSLLKKSY